MNRRWRTILAIVIPSVIVDQLTKEWAVRELSDRSISVLPTIDFSLTYNSGFSFGTGESFGPVVGVAVLLIVGFLVFRLAKEDHPRRVLLFSFILGGALGNLIDRLFRTDGGWPLTGEVVDFIDVSWYAVFNVADAILVVAVVAFLVTEVLDNRRIRATEGEPDRAVPPEPPA